MKIYVLRGVEIDEQQADNRKEGFRYLIEDGTYVRNSFINEDGMHFDNIALAEKAQNAEKGRLDKTIEALGLGGQA